MNEEAVKVSRDELRRALEAASVPSDRTDAVWAALTERPSATPDRAQRLDAPNVFFYLGALVVIFGLSGIAGTTWEAWGDGAMLAISIVYAVGFALAGRLLIARGWWTPGGLSVTAAVVMVPLIVYSFQAATGLWPGQEPFAFSDYHVEIRAAWVAMEVATIGAAAIALRFVSFPFLVAPLAFCAWYLSMDLAPLLFGGGAEEVTDTERASVSIAVGLVMIVASFLLAERRNLSRHAFWGYLFGLLSYFGGTLYHCYETSEFLWWVTGVSGMLCLFAAVLLERRVFAVFGGIALFSWLAYLSSKIFEDTAAQPFVLTAVGIGIVAFGIVYQRRRDDWRAALLATLPQGLVRSLPTYRRGQR